jgi:flagellar hook-associated protein 1 FlgK
MSDLLSSLSSAARALDAQTLGLQVTGQNIANINTPGYTRRTVDLAEVPPVNATSAGGGVTVVAIRAQRAALLEAQLRHEQPSQSREAAIADSLSRVEASLGAAGDSVDASLSQFYSAFSVLAQDPTSGVARQQVVVQGQSLAISFNDIASRLGSAQHDVDTQVRSAVDGINTLASQISSLNASLSGGTGNESIRDQLGAALASLSQLVDIGVVSQPSGSVDVSIGNGHALVVGANAYKVDITAAAGTGLADLSLGGSVITSEVTGGTVGGLLQVRDVLLPGYRTRLDQLAYGVATSVNAAHRAGYDLAGNPGGDFFVPPVTVAGAATAMAVSSPITANPALVAAAATTSPGDNQNARAIAALAGMPLAGGTTNPVDTWGSLVYRIGTDAQVAAHEQKSRDEVVRQLQTLRDQVSGVSLDEEATNLIKFQRAYEANARYFSAVQTSLSTLMQMLGE